MMFKRHDVFLQNNPLCEKAVDNIQVDDFLYYDIDGFELNQAEQKYYAAMNYPLHHAILNHRCWQEPWFELEKKDSGLILDHSMFLCRAGYVGRALDQLKDLRTQTLLVDFLINTKVKWGFDFALLGVRDNTIFEVIHIEYDSRDYQTFCNQFLNMEYTIRHTDWHKAADDIWDNRDQWLNLKGFDQNNWKSNFLIGWSKSEYTEKAI